MEKIAVNNKDIPREPQPKFLYKFRSLENYKYVLDILLNERLYCSLYKDLNDPFEGTFIEIIYKMWRGGPRIGPPIPRKKIEKFKTVDELPIDLSKSRVCSLSSDCEDVRLWAYYANGGKGIAIKINSEDINSNLYRINYLTGLRKLVSKNNLDNPDYFLTHKTDHWIYESEYRLIYPEKYYPIKVDSILLGPRIDDQYKDLLMRIVSERFNIYNTKLNMEDIKIEIYK
jgi:hypothetical protein